MVSRIAALNNMKKYLGYIISTIPESTFSQILNQAGSTENTSVLLFNSHGEVIVQNDSCLPFFTPKKAKEMAEEYHLAARGSLKEIQCDGSSYLVGLRAIDKSDWTLAIMIPSADFRGFAVLYARYLHDKPFPDFPDCPVKKADVGFQSRYYHSEKN